MRISLLYQGEYSQWVERFMNYLKEQTDGEAMINSIKNSDQPLPRVTQVSIAETTSTEQPPLKDKSMDKDKDPSAGSDRGSKRRKLRKDAESSKDSKSKEKKSSSTYKDVSQSQHKSYGKSVHAEEPSHSIGDSGVQQDQEFVTGDNDE
nr:hypothetical protein [Tanacetum cinerariifolium]